MLFLSFVTLGLVSALSLATPAKRAPALEVSLTAPTNVDSIGDIKVTAAVTNTGSEDVKVIKYGTILDNTNPTRSFRITKDGAAADFTGIKLSLVNLESLTDAAFAVIPAGETVLVEHEVASLYNFEALGTGAFEFEPITTFNFLGEDASKQEFKVSASKFTVNVNKDVAKREVLGLEKRARTSCSNSNQASFISASYTEGKSLASIAANYINSRGANDALYRSYFGTSSTSTIRGRFTNVANENSSSRILGCTDPARACDGNVIAYTIISNTNIYFCSIFFQEVPQTQLCGGTTVNARNVRGATTLHELTHAVSGTDDITYGCPADQRLSPSQQAINADNYNCFASQVYANTQC